MNACRTSRRRTGGALRHIWHQHRASGGAYHWANAVVLKIAKWFQYHQRNSAASLRCERTIDCASGGRKSTTFITANDFHIDIGDDLRYRVRVREGPGYEVLGRWRGGARDRQQRRGSNCPGHAEIRAVALVGAARLDAALGERANRPRRHLRRECTGRTGLNIKACVPNPRERHAGGNIDAARNERHGQVAIIAEAIGDRWRRSTLSDRSKADAW